MEKLFFNFVDFMYGHNWISVLVLAVVALIFIWKATNFLWGAYVICVCSILAGIFQINHPTEAFVVSQIATALVLTSLYLAGYIAMVAAALFFAFSVPIGSVLLWGRISTAGHRRREEAEKSRLAKAVVVSFPYNHLKVLGMEKLKKYVPPAAGIFFFLNLTGCDGNFDAAIFSVFTLFVVAWVTVILAALAVVSAVAYLVWRVVRHFRRAEEKWELEKAKGELLQSLSLIDDALASGRATQDADVYEGARKQKERQLDKIEARLAELE